MFVRKEKKRISLLTKKKNYKEFGVVINLKDETLYIGR